MSILEIAASAKIAEMGKRAELITYQFGEWRVEPSLNRIVRDDNAFHVEPRTLSVLTYLLDRPGRLVSVDEMLDEVWPGRFVEPNAIQRHIARIRHLLNDDAYSPKYVETISKRGYRVIAPVQRNAYSLTPEVVQPATPINGRLTDAIPIRNVLPRSIAVLPFASLSPDPDHAYFAAGIHEEILNRLAKIRDLSVIARTTMLRYANTQLSIPEIGSELNVQTVMEGSVRYAGNRVRITVQLIDAQSGVHLWSEAYDENLEDIFAVQLAIASRIARSLHVELSVAEKQRIGLKATESPQAHSFYLKALSMWGNLAATAPVHEALDAAISIDPAFSAAVAFKAWIRATEASFHNLFGMEKFAVDDQEALISEAERLAHRALALNDSETLARLALSSVYLHDHRWQAAREVVDRIPTDTSEYIALTTAGCCAWRGWGDVASAIRLMERSIELNPADGANIWFFGVLLYWAQQWRAAARQAQIVVEMLPDIALGYALHALVSSRMGERDAVYHYATLAEARQAGLADLATIARAYGQIGDQRQARRVFDSAGAGARAGNQASEWQFWMHMAVNDYESAMRSLEQAVATNFPQKLVVDLHYESAHPDFDPLRCHPRFAALVGRAAAPVRRTSMHADGGG